MGLLLGLLQVGVRGGERETESAKPEGRGRPQGGIYHQTINGC
jgi:hypothetical protein